jgi:hypothetical protein
MSMQARFALLALGLALAPTSALSQAEAPQAAQGQTPQPRELSVAPNAPTKTPEPESGAGARVPSQGRANICDELVAFLKQPKPAGAPGAGSGQPASTAATQPVSPGQTAPPVDRPQQSSGQSAPIPGNDHPESATAPIALERAQLLQQANDRPACQNAARQMRRAGVALPPGLLALAALREELLAGSERRDP